MEENICYSPALEKDVYLSRRKARGGKEGGEIPT